MNKEDQEYYEKEIYQLQKNVVQYQRQVEWLFDYITENEHPEDYRHITDSIKDRMYKETDIDWKLAEEITKKDLLGSEPPKTEHSWGDKDINHSDFVYNMNTNGPYCDMVVFNIQKIKDSQENYIYLDKNDIEYLSKEFGILTPF